jgi:sister-chromatid-cohesion protein PDS5
VRLAFLTKTILLLQPRKLPARYNVIPFLTVLDPEPETKNMVCASLSIYVEFLNSASQAVSYVENAKRKLSPGTFLHSSDVRSLKFFFEALRLEIFELLFIRLLHFLAHHPDFATTQEELMELAR